MEEKPENKHKQMHDKVKELFKELETFTESLVIINKKCIDLLAEIKEARKRNQRDEVTKKIKELVSVTGKRGDALYDILPVLRFMIQNADTAMDHYIKEIGFMNDFGKTVQEASGLDIPSELLDHEPWI